MEGKQLPSEARDLSWLGVRSFTELQSWKHPKASVTQDKTVRIGGSTEGEPWCEKRLQPRFNYLSLRVLGQSRGASRAGKIRRRVLPSNHAHFVQMPSGVGVGVAGRTSRNPRLKIVQMRSLAVTSHMESDGTNRLLSLWVNYIVRETHTGLQNLTVQPVRNPWVFKPTGIGPYSH